MKTIVSIPDEVFARAKRFAKQTRRSRSELYSAAVREYVERHAPEHVTDAMNRVCAEIDTKPDPLVVMAGRRTLERSKW